MLDRCGNQLQGQGTDRINTIIDGASVEYVWHFNFWLGLRFYTGSCDSLPG